MKSSKLRYNYIVYIVVLRVEKHDEKILSSLSLPTHSLSIIFFFIYFFCISLVLLSLPSIFLFTELFLLFLIYRKEKMEKKWHWLHWWLLVKLAPDYKTHKSFFIFILWNHHKEYRTSVRVSVSKKRNENMSTSIELTLTTIPLYCHGKL